MYHESPIIKESKLKFMEIPVVPKTKVEQIDEKIIVHEDNLLMAITGLTE